MDEKIQSLYQQLKEITFRYWVYRLRQNIEKTKKIIPEIQEFVLWFLEENIFGIDEELYQGMSENLVNILQDILTALQQEDMVLLHDAIAYGLLEYVQLFVDTDQEAEAHDII